MRVTRRAILAGSLSAAFLSRLHLPSMAPAAASPGCIFAAPTGHDSEPGTPERPVQTFARAVQLTGPQGGVALAAGSFDAIKLPHPVIVAALQTGKSELKGRLWVPDGVDGAQFHGLHFDGRNPTNLPSITVHGNDTVFDSFEVANAHTTIAFLLGDPRFGGRAARTILRRGLIHEVGPVGSLLDHGVYDCFSAGTNMLDLEIRDCSGRAIQLYPDGQAGLIQRVYAHDNGCGLLFSGAGGKAASNWTVEDSTFVRALAPTRHAVESWYPGGNPHGTGNVLRRCVSDDIGPQDGFRWET